MKRTSVMKEALASCTTMAETREATLRVEQEMGDGITSLINSYHSADWPILAAVMKITLENLVNTMDPTQRLLYEMTVRMLGAVSMTVEVKNDG